MAAKKYIQVSSNGTDVNRLITNTELWDLFMESRSELKDDTIRCLLNVRKCFLDFFDPQGDPQSITDKEITQMKNYMLSCSYANVTIEAHINHIRMFFEWSVKNGYLKNNPFRNMCQGASTYVGKDFISMEDYEKLLAACPDQISRTLLTLCRIGGLRNPSETLALKWSDVNWDQNYLLVHSPQTDPQTGECSRKISLYPPLRTELEKQFKETGPGTKDGGAFIIDQQWKMKNKMKAYYQKIALSVGVSVPPCLFRSLRNSRCYECPSIQ